LLLGAAFYAGLWLRAVAGVGANHATDRVHTPQPHGAGRGEIQRLRRHLLVNTAFAGLARPGGATKIRLVPHRNATRSIEKIGIASVLLRTFSLAADRAGALGLLAGRIAANALQAELLAATIRMAPAASISRRSQLKTCRPR